MNTDRWVSLAMIALAAILYLLSTTPEHAEAFIFPEIIALILLFIAMLAIVRSWGSGGEPDEEQARSRIPWRVVWPALLIFVLYLNLAEVLGFYITALFAFIAVAALYAPEENALVRLGKMSAVALGFIAVLYAVFTLLLRVQMPTGIAI